MALLTNLSSYWKLDESSGNASDSVGSRTLTNQGTITYAAAKINNGSVFNGSSQYFTFSDTGLPSGTGARSISLWVKPDALPSSGGRMSLIGYGTANTSQYFGLEIQNNGGTHQIAFIGYLNDKVWTHTLSTSVYTHLVIVYDGDSVLLYINNSAQSDQAITINTALSAGQVGRIATTNYFDGNLDEIGIWAKALSAGEVSQLYNSGNGLSYPFYNYILTMGTGAYTLTGWTFSSKNSSSWTNGSKNSSSWTYTDKN